MKFNVGDIVKVIQDNLGGYADAIGHVAEIVEVNEYDEYPYILKFNDYMWHEHDELLWEEESLELVSSHKESRDEVMSIINYALEFLEKNSDDNKFACANGSVWAYDDVRKFIEKYLK
jgi:hypothetical protein